MLAMRRSSRRTHLQSLLGAAAAVAVAAVGGMASGARAIGGRSELSIGVIRHGAGWDHRPEAVRRLLWETAKRTSIHVARDRTVVSLEDDSSAEAKALFWQPLLLWTGTGAIAPLSQAARGRLERHLRFGGTLWVDSDDAAFLTGALAELAPLFGNQKPTRLPLEHVVFKSFFLVPRAEGCRRVDDTLEAYFLGDRPVVVISRNDMLGAYERDRFGTWRFECQPEGAAQRERAFRLGINILMMATCLDYKADQVHIPFIMKKKRR
jgi:hypothetical protein